MNMNDVHLVCSAANIDYAVAGSDCELGEGVFFRWNGPDGKAPQEGVHVRADTLAKLTSAELLKIVINGRDVKQMTRIVGYFSQVQNWNKSKIGELKDRHAGNYHVGSQDSPSA